MKRKGPVSVKPPLGRGRHNGAAASPVSYASKILGEQPTQLPKAGELSFSCSKESRNPRMECGTTPKMDSDLSGAAPFRGCCRSDDTSSTARALAMEARPGLTTVHCWSRVLFLVELSGAAT